MLKFLTVYNKFTYHFRNSAICSKGHMEKVSYNKEAKDLVRILDWNRSLSSYRNKIKLYFFNYTYDHTSTPDLRANVSTSPSAPTTQEK